MPSLSSSKIKIYSTIFTVFHTVLSIISSYHIANLDSDISTAAQYGASVIISIFLGITLYILLTVASQLKDYSLAISKSREDRAFELLSSGLAVLIASIVTTSLLNLLRLPPTESLSYSSLTILIYYFAGIFSFIYLSIIGLAGFEFAKFSKKSRFYYLFLFVIGLIVMGASSAFWDNSIVNSIHDSSHILSFLDSDIVFYYIFVFIVLGWIFALASIFGIVIYQTYTKSKIYSRAMLQVSVGIGLLVTVSSLRHLSDYMYGSFAYITLTSDIGRVSVMLGIVILSCIFINSGISKLQKIESVT